MSCITPSEIICISFPRTTFTSGFKAFRMDRKERGRTQCTQDTCDFAMHNGDYSSMASENLFLPLYRIPHYMVDNSPAEAYECHP